MKKIMFVIPFAMLTMAGWAEHKGLRDPFVNLAQKPPAIQVDEVPHANSQPILARAHRENQAKIFEAAPKLNVLGLVTNSLQPKAIVAGAKSTYVVAQGDKLGDYRVAKIDRSGITLAYKQTRYHCPLAQERP